MFASILTFSQEFHFDYKLKYATNAKNKKSTYEHYVDSKTGNTCKISNSNSEYYGIVNSENDKVQYVLKIFKDDVNDDIYYKIGQNKITAHPKKEYDGKEIVKINKIDPLNFQVCIYKNSKLKTKVLEAIVSFAESEINDIIFPVDHILSDKIVEEITNQLPSNSKFITKNITYSYSNSNKFSKSTVLEKTDFLVRISN